jgi:hypothetical protein
MNASTGLLTRLITPAGLLALALVGTGCVATVSSRPAYYDGYAVVYEDDAPYDVYSYPRYQHNGTYVYLVGDRWYYRSSSGWAYYRDEPPALWHHRRSYYGTYGYAAPPAYGAPPAARVYAPPPAYAPAASPAYAPAASPAYAPAAPAYAPAASPAYGPAPAANAPPPAGATAPHPGYAPPPQAAPPPVAPTPAYPKPAAPKPAAPKPAAPKPAYPK